MKENKYKYILLSLLIMFAVPTMAQQLKKATAAKAKSMISTIAKYSKAMSAMTANFTQKSSFSFMDEPVVSYGSMVYSVPLKLEWIYTKPYKYTFVIEGNKVTTKSGKHTSTMDLSTNSMFKSISKMAFSSINGDSFTSNRDFTVIMYTRGNYWVGVLTPRSEAMKNRLKNVTIEYDPAIHNVRKIDMTHKNGDFIAIEFKNIKTSTHKTCK